jgi:hypothetical protein
MRPWPEGTKEGGYVYNSEWSYHRRVVRLKVNKSLRYVYVVPYCTVAVAVAPPNNLFIYMRLIDLMDRGMTTHVCVGICVSSRVCGVGVDVGCW